MTKIAIQGCIHGEMKRCYQQVPRDADCVLWAGDIQCTRDEIDLASMACPEKYKRVGDFPYYASGLSEVPADTLFIGGNHECSSLFNMLPYGGWVAPKMMYLGRVGVINAVFEDGERVRIAGLSGIYNQGNYRRGYFETDPFDNRSIKSVYHVREHDLVTLSHLSGADIVMTHDWPADLLTGPGAQADKQRLLKRKPFFKDDINKNELGNPHLAALQRLKPSLWVAAHLHVNFRCSYGDSVFVAHDKPKRGPVATSMWDLTKLTSCHDAAMAVPKTASYATMPAKEEEGLAPKRQRLEKRNVQYFVDLEWIVLQKRAQQHRSVAFHAQTSPLVDGAILKKPVTKDELAHIKQFSTNTVFGDDATVPIAHLSQFLIAVPSYDANDLLAFTRWWDSLLNPNSLLLDDC